VATVCCSLRYPCRAATAVKLFSAGPEASRPASDVPLEYKPTAMAANKAVEHVQKVNLAFADMFLAGSLSCV
ncbi:jg22521, partial [Pararge aegeria aegeria]